MTRAIRIAVVGVGGFGRVHENAVLSLQEQGLVEVVAFVEPNEHNVQNSILAANKVRHYRSFDDLLDANPKLEAVTIATPIPYHYPMARMAFERGLHLFLEKPPVVCIQHLRELVAAQHKAGVHCAVGFHDMARSDVIRLKERLCEGAIGKVKAIRAEARWLRTDAYYTRSTWSGKLRLGEAWVLDGPMNNACAHVVNVAAYLAGTQPQIFARPLSVQGELYRAADIEGEDTDCLRAQMDSGVEICVHLTQCASVQSQRTWTIIGEKGVAELSDVHGMTIAGERMPSASAEPLTEHLLRRLIHVIQGVETSVLMPLIEAEGHLLLSNGAYESAGSITSIAPCHTTRKPEGDSTATIIPDIEKIIATATREGKLLSECGLPWARRTEPFDLANYSEFPTRWHP